MSTPSTSSSSSIPPSRSLYDTNPQIATMVDMVDCKFDLDDATLRYMSDVRQICAKAATELTGARTTGVSLDGGQMNAAIQLLQQVKNKACDAAILGCENRKRAAAAAAAADAEKKRKTAE